MTAPSSTRDSLEVILREWAAGRIYIQEAIDKIEAVYAKPIVVDYDNYSATYLRAIEDGPHWKDILHKYREGM